MEADQPDSSGDSKPPIELTPELSRFIENMGLHYESYGVPRIGGRILGLLLITQEPLAPEQIADALRVSRSSISTNLRVLLMTGLAEKVSLPGERRDFFVFSPEAWENSLQARMQGILELKELAEDGLAAFPEDDPAVERLQEMARWVDLVEGTIEKMINRWQSRRKEPA